MAALPVHCVQTISNFQTHPRGDEPVDWPWCWAWGRRRRGRGGCVVFCVEAEQQCESREECERAAVIPRRHVVCLPFSHRRKFLKPPVQHGVISQPPPVERIQRIASPSCSALVLTVKWNHLPAPATFSRAKPLGWRLPRWTLITKTSDPRMGLRRRLHQARAGQRSSQVLASDRSLGLDPRVQPLALLMLGGPTPKMLGVALHFLRRQAKGTG